MFYLLRDLVYLPKKDKAFAQVIEEAAAGSDGYLEVVGFPLTEL